MSILKPTFEHDCADCKFLGALVTHKGVCDIYLHERAFTDSEYVCRYGDYGGDYIAHTVGQKPTLLQALRLCESK